MTRVSNSTGVLTPRIGDTWVNPVDFVREGDFDDPDRFNHYFNAITFTRELIGGWIDPYHEWNVDGTSFTDSFLLKRVSVSKQWDFSPEEFADLSDKTGGETKFVTLRVTDVNTGIVANATYTIRLHHPYEKWRKIGDLADIAEDVVDLRPEQPGVAYAHGSIHCTWNIPDPMWKLLSVAVTVGSSDIRESLWKYFFRAAGIGLSDLGPKPDGGSAVFDSCWGTAESTISGNWSDDKGLYEMTPRLVLMYHAYKYEADGYGSHGYTGLVHEGATDPSPFRKVWAGDFNPYSPPIGSGS